MDSQQTQEEILSYRGRTVSDLALMYESKIREKVRSSPYLRHYGKFKGPKLNFEKYPPPKSKYMTSPMKIQSLLVAQYEEYSESPDAVFSATVNDAEPELVTGNAISLPQPCYSKPDSYEELNICGQLSVKKQCTEGKRSSSQSSGSSFLLQAKELKSRERIEAIPCVNTSLTDLPKNETKRRRSKSFTNGIQRFLKRERRRGSLDARDTEKFRKKEDQIDDFDDVFENATSRTPSRSRWRLGKEKQEEAIGTQIISSNTRRRSDDDSAESCDASKKGPKRKNSRLKGFFRAISLNNIGEAKRNAMFSNDNCCPNCKESQLPRMKVLSLERFNSLKDERDLLRNERDRAVEEWSEAASRWEQMLDDMDSLMTELIQVKNERDEKTSEIRELINEYEDELKIRETDYDRQRADFAELEDKLSVAKKERIDALTEYDELLKRNYDLSKDLEKFEDLSMELRSCVAVNEQDIESLRQQLENVQDERDHALELWNASVEERKKLHKEMASLIQARDESLRKTFQQAEEINKMREDRDALQRVFDTKRMNGNTDVTTVRGSHNHITAPENHVINDDSDLLSAANHEELVPDFVELAVSLERLDSKYGIRVDTAVDEPKIMVAHVGAHAGSTSNIRKYDRIISVNGASVVRADKKAVEKLIRDCPGRLTMVLRRETSADKFECMKDVEITLPKNSYHRGYRDLGLKFNVQVVSVDDHSPIGGREKIDNRDIITKINTQDISKVLEAVLYKIAKKHAGKISLRLQKRPVVTQKRAEVTNDEDEGTQKASRESPSHTSAYRTISNVSDASNLSLSSMTSEQTYTSTYADDDESLFSGSLTPSIVVCPCDENEEDTCSLQGRIRNLSNAVLESDSTAPKQDDSPSTNRRVMDGALSSNAKFSSNGHQRLSKRHSDIHSLRSLKMVSSARTSKQPLRRVRSDAVDRKAAQKVDVASTPGGLLLAVAEHEAAQERSHSSWLIPSPTHTPKENRRGTDAVSVFATLPRQKKKSVNEADCNKRTTHRVLRLEKTENQTLGFDVCGGNKVGIFVKEIKDGSMAALGGMKVGDRILYINSFDLHCATLDFATRIILKSERLTNFRIEVKFEERFKDLLKEVPRDSLYVRTLRAIDNSKDGGLQFGVGEILHVTNTLANYSKVNRNSWQWHAEKVSRHSAGQQGYVPRLESFGEDTDTHKSHNEVEGSPDRSLTTEYKRKRRRSASDVKKWLLRKPSVSKKKKEREIKAAIADIGDKGPFYEILWDS